MAALYAIEWRQSVRTGGGSDENIHLKAVLVVACPKKGDLRPARAGAKRNPSASRGHVGAFWPAVPASDDAIRPEASNSNVSILTRFIAAGNYNDIFAT